jgi:hypothetical protein
MLELPFFRTLVPCRRILLAGAGGGYDIFCGLPLYFALRAAGKEVWLANLSFSPLELVEGADTPVRGLLRVNADSQPPRAVNYFPEGYLCQWFRQRGEEVPIYCFERQGVVHLRAGYEALLGQLEPDAIVLVDGGTDSLMRGDEAGLGTPHEDLASIAAVIDLPVSVKLLVCLGFGIDAFHGVCHTDFLEAVADLTRSGDYLGAFSLLPDMPEARLYREAAEFVFSCMPHHPSIVTSSILSAVEGQYGDHHVTERTAGRELWINPLMGLYWCLRLAGVARRVLYLEALKGTRTWSDVDHVIREFRYRLGTPRPARGIPL